MSWSSSDRRSRLPADWPRRRRRILRRDGHRCQLRYDGCRGIATEVDHIVNDDNHDDHNLHAVCEPCHAIKTQTEAADGRAVIRERGLRAPEPHPGGG